MIKIPLIFLLLTVSTVMQAQRVMVSIVGDAGSGFSGDGGPAQFAQISGAYDVCMDGSRNIYFVDAGNNRIRKISDATGIITTVAGGGTSHADGILATDAALNMPKYMCIDVVGNMYVTSNNCVRKISTAGIITTVAGTPGTSGYAGDGGPATSGLMSSPHGLAVDPAGNLYIVDQDNSAIRKVSTTGIITSIAGNGTTTGYTGEGGLSTASTLFRPIAIAVNNAGDVFFSDDNGAFIRKIAASTSIITTYAGGYGMFVDGVPATTTTIGRVWGVCVDDTGNVFIDDESCSCRKINASDNLIYRVAGDFTMEGYNGDGSDARLCWLHEPYGLHVDQKGSVLIADNMNNRIRKAIQLSHTPSFAFGRGQSIKTCTSFPVNFDDRLRITDMDAGQTETWMVASAPAHGVLSGFPVTATSVGAGGLVMPHGLSYTPATGYSGNDVFQVQVSDGSLSETVTIHVIVGGTPVTAGTITGATTVCATASIILAETVTGGVWSTSNTNAYADYSGTVTGYTPGLDSVIYTVTGTCNTAVAYHVINVLPAADAGHISGAGFVHTGAITPMSESIPGGVWSSSDNTVATVSTGGVVTGVSTGTATISYMVSGSPCDGVATTYMSVNDTGIITGVKNIAAISEVKVAPNPSKGHFSITIKSTTDEVMSITMFNTLGSKVKELPVLTNNPVNVELNVPAGIYFINATGANGKWTGKVVVE